MSEEDLAWVGVELGHGDIIIGAHGIDKEGQVKALTFRHSAKINTPGAALEDIEYATPVVHYIAFKDDAAVQRLIATLQRLQSLEPSS